MGSRPTRFPRWLGNLLVVDLLIITWSQVDPNTSSQFLLDCMCLLLRAGRGAIFKPSISTESTLDDDGEPYVLQTEADIKLPDAILQQRFLLCHMMLDLIQQPFTVRHVCTSTRLHGVVYLPCRNNAISWHREHSRPTNERCKRRHMPTCLCFSWQSSTPV